MRPAGSIALWCAAVAVAVCGTAVAATVSVHDGRVTSLVHMSRGEPLASVARDADPDFAFVHPQAHYDGVYFYAIAVDPFARGGAHRLVDRAAYRYGHPGYGWLAWIVSAGSPGRVPIALLVIGLAGVAVAGFAGSRLAADFGWSPWWGLVAAFTPGIVYATTADTSEPVALAIVALALLAWGRRRWGWAATALAAGCFVKEPLILVPVGLAVWEVIEWRRGRKDSRVDERLIALAIGPAMYAGWYLYLRGTFGVWPFRQETNDFLTLPLAGWWDSMRRAARLGASSFDQMQLGNAAVPLLAVTGGLLLFGLVRAARMKTPADPVFILLAVLMLSLNWYGVLYPKDLIRETAVATALLPLAFAGARLGAGPDPGPRTVEQGNDGGSRTS